MIFLEPFLEAPLANVLIVIGVLIIFAAIFGGLPGMDRIDEKGRKAAWVLGPLLVAVGLMFVVGLLPPIDTNGDTTGEPQNSSPTSTPTPELNTDTPEPTVESAVLESEPNENLGTATVLESDSIGEGVVNPTDAYGLNDVDCFAFPVTAGESVSVEVARTAGSGTLYTYLSNRTGHSEPSGYFLSDLLSVPSGESVRQETVARTTGYYYVVVGNAYYDDYGSLYSDGGFGEYTIRVETGNESQSVSAEDGATGRPAPE
jgi:hypothetical protein